MWEVDLLIRLVHTAVVVCSGGIVNYFDQQIHVLLEYCRCLWYSNVLNVSWAVSPAPSSSSLYTSEIPLPHFPSTWGPCQSSNLLRAPNHVENILKLSSPMKSIFRYSRFSIHWKSLNLDLWHFVTWIDYGHKLNASLIPGCIPSTDSLLHTSAIEGQHLQSATVVEGNINKTSVLHLHLILIRVWVSVHMSDDPCSTSALSC